MRTGSTTIVTSVEAGPLEAQVLLLVNRYVILAAHGAILM